MDMQELVAVLGDAPRRLAESSFRGALDEAVDQFGNEIADNFLRAEDVGGSPWPEHAPLTVMLYGVHPLLRLTYKMYGAAIDADDPNALKILEDRRVTIGIDGTAIPYAWKQDEGAGRIPKREFFYLNDDGVERVGKIIEEAGFDVINAYVFPG